MLYKRIIAGLSALLLGIQVIPTSVVSAVDTNNLKEISLKVEEIGSTTDVKVQVETGGGYKEVYNYNDLSTNLVGCKSLYVPYDTTKITFIDCQYTEAKNDDSVICVVDGLDAYTSIREKYKINGMYKPYELIYNPSTDTEISNIVLKTYVESDMNLSGEFLSNDMLLLKQQLIFGYNVIQTGAYMDEEDNTGGNLSIKGRDNNYCNVITLNGDIYAENNLTLKFINECFNGNLLSNNINLDARDGVTFSSAPFDFNKDMLLSEDDVNEIYFSNALQTESTTEINEQNLNINENRAFADDITFNATSGMTLNASIKSDGDININGEVHNGNNSVIYSKENITIQNNSTFSYTGLIYAPNGIVHITAQNVNITGCIIAKEVIIEADTVNFNVNNYVISNNNDMVLTDLQLFIADMNYDGVVDDKDLDIMKRIILGLDRDSTYIPYEEWSTLEDSDGDGIPDIFAFDNWINLNDWDEDGIPDSVESYFGTNKYIKDTDNDELTDYEELFYTYTDPLVYDSLIEGVSDGNADSDEDGLSNLQELYHETDPLNVDSDNDSLSDYAEIFQHSTNPLLYDTDGDGVSDGKEILISTNPLVWDSNNIVDYNYNLDSSFGILKRMSFTTSASACETLEVENLSGIDTLTENVVGAIGVPIKVSTSVSSSEKIESNWFLSYSDICETLDMDTVDLNDIDVLYYNDTEQQYEIVEKTITDTSNENLKNISFDVVNNGTYVVIYTPTWTSAWENAPDYTKDANTNIGYNTVLTIDCSTSMGNSFQNTSRIESVKTSARTYINQMTENDKTSIVSFGGTTNTECGFLSTDTDENLKKLNTNINNLSATQESTDIYNALNNSITLLAEYSTANPSSNKNIIILLSDGEDRDYTESKMNSLLQKAKENNIVIYTIALGEQADRDKLNKTATGTGGCFTSINNSYSDTSHIYDAIQYVKWIDPTDNDEDGLPDYYEQTGIQLINGQFIPANELKTCSANSTELNKKSSADTDNDGLLDGEEIQAKYLSEYMLSKNVTQPNANKLTFVMKSDPRKADSDNDGLNDYAEKYTYKTNPNKSDIIITSLSDPNYINVNYTGSYVFYGNLNPNNSRISFGGKQEWTWNDKSRMYFNNKFTADETAAEGCGLIATTDLLLYLSKNDSSLYNKNLINKMYNFSTKTFDYNEYMNLLQENSNKYEMPLITFKTTGLTGLQMQAFLNSQKDNFNDIDYSAYWQINNNNNIMSQIMLTGSASDIFLNTTKQMLYKDIPVIFSYWQEDNLVKFGIVSELPLYLDKELKNYEQSVRAHYMVITRVFEYSEDLQKYNNLSVVLEVSSWGRRYYINYNDYASEISPFTNMMYLST